MMEFGKDNTEQDTWPCCRRAGWMLLELVIWHVQDMKLCSTKPSRMLCLRLVTLRSASIIAMAIRQGPSLSCDSCFERHRMFRLPYDGTAVHIACVSIHLS